MADKIVVISCGTAVATSTVVARAIEEACKEAGISVTTRQCKAAEVRQMAQGADLIVTTTPIPSDIGVPVIQGLSFLTGVGKDETLKQIVEALSD